MRPRILFLCSACPFGHAVGSGMRTRQIARLLDRIGQVTLVAVPRTEWSREQVEETKREFAFGGLIQTHPSPESLAGRWRTETDPRSMNTLGTIVHDEDRRQVAGLVESHDMVWLHTFPVADVFRRFHWPRSVMDADDYPSQFHASAARLTSSLLRRLNRWRKVFAWRRREAVWQERFTLLAVCKDEDCSHFGGNGRVHVIPNGFATPRPVRRQPSHVRPRLGMIGNFSFLPNADGLAWFLSGAWRKVREKIPAAELRLVGKASEAAAHGRETDGLSGLGYLPDPAAEIATWSAIVIPTRAGGGSHLKFAEALARRVPIITTPHGARGYEVREGVHAWIADSEEKLADACVRLIGDHAAGDRLSEAGWKLFREKYSWDSIAGAVESAVSHCLSLSDHR